MLDGGADLGIAFDGDGDRIACVDERGELVDGDGIVAILALDLGVDLVCVTQMTNLGFHALMARAAGSASSRPTSATATCSRRSSARAACSAASSPVT